MTPNPDHDFGEPPEDPRAGSGLVAACAASALFMLGLAVGYGIAVFTGG